MALADFGVFNGEADEAAEGVAIAGLARQVSVIADLHMWTAVGGEHGAAEAELHVVHDEFDGAKEFASDGLEARVVEHILNAAELVLEAFDGEGEGGLGGLHLKARGGARFVSALKSEDGESRSGLAHLVGVFRKQMAREAGIIEGAQPAFSNAGAFFVVLRDLLVKVFEQPSVFSNIFGNHVNLSLVYRDAKPVCVPAPTASKPK